jgi:lipopolysaccharide-induced tumor necrosis factor-alpha factor
MPQGPYSTQQMGQSHPGSGQPMHTPPPMMQQQSYGVLVGNSQPMQMQPGMSQGGQPQMMHPQMSHQNSNFGVNQGGRQYQNATPLQVLGRGAAPVDCPSCGVRAMTRTNYEVGNTTQ